jgi:biotin-dependent carboxylase-like uncharacterized protein
VLKIHNPGFYTSIQDLGRFGYRHLGVPVSGAIHLRAAGQANALLENHPNDAMLEITMNGPELEFTEPTALVLTGAPLEAYLDGTALDMNRVYTVPGGAIFKSGHVREGLRSYLCVKGGFQTEVKLGSRSQFYPVTPTNTITKGAQIPYEPVAEFSPKLLSLKPSKRTRGNTLIASPGPEFELLGEEHLKVLFASEFEVSKNHNRMACQLEPALPPHEIRMITSATLPGTVQLTPAGKLIILLRDGQTTGGYPRILQLDAKSQDRIGQKQFGDAVRFERNGSS